MQKPLEERQKSHIFSPKWVVKEIERQKEIDGMWNR